MRNPKINPRTGDVFSGPTGNRFLVHFEENGVVYGQKIGRDPIESVTLVSHELVRLPLKEFRDSARSSDVSFSRIPE